VTVAGGTVAFSVALFVLVFFTAATALVTAAAASF
jgi:hypothetical protein